MLYFLNLNSLKIIICSFKEHSLHIMVIIESFYRFITKKMLLLSFNTFSILVQLS